MYSETEGPQSLYGGGGVWSGLWWVDRRGWSTWSLSPFKFFTADLCGCGWDGQGCSRQRDHFGIREACWGIRSAPWCLENKAHGGVKDLRAQPGLVWLQQEGFLRPPLLSSIPGPTSNRKVWRDCFSFQRAVCPGPRLVCPACLCPCSGYRETTVWLSRFRCECSAQLSVFLACFCVLGVDLQSMTSERQCRASCARYSEFVTASRATDMLLFCELHDQFGLIKNEVGKWECLQGHQRVLLGQRTATR